MITPNLKITINWQDSTNEQRTDLTMEILSLFTRENKAIPAKLEKYNKFKDAIIVYNHNSATQVKRPETLLVVVENHLDSK